VSALLRDYLRTFACPGEGEPNPAAALFAALDRAQGFSGGERMTREDAHEC